MKSKLQLLMEDWLANGDETQKRHAMARIAMGFGGDHVPAPVVSEPPSLLRKAASLTAAVARHVAAGMPTLPDEAVAARMAVCAACPERLANGTCAGCGCNLKRKATMPLEQCPKGYWESNPTIPGKDVR